VAGIKLVSDFSQSKVVNVELDSKKIRQVLRHIISNAFKFSKEGSEVTMSTEIINSSSQQLSSLGNETSHGNSHNSKRNIKSLCKSNCTYRSYSPNQIGNFEEWIDGNTTIPSDSTPNFSAQSSRSGSIASSDDLESTVPFIRISIKDSGPGFSQEELLTLFGEFNQAKATQLQSNGGSGLGLWVARNIVEAHNGRVGVLSEGHGKGATFFIDLPICRISIKDTDESIDHNISVKNEDHGVQIMDMTSAKKLMNNNTLCNIKSVLLVDDSATHRKMMRRLLETRERLNYIDEACDGRQALHTITQRQNNFYDKYDVIMMDSVMPEMPGPEAVRELRGQGYEGLIVGVTGNSLQTDIDAFLEAGVNRVMTKPLDIDAFLAYAKG
jgi:CheY-like chemotaxis protein